MPIACALQTIFVVSVYFFRGDPVFPRSVLVFYWLLNTLLLAGGRELVFRRLVAERPRRMVLIGASTDVARFLEGLERARPADYEMRGWIATEEKLGDPTVCCHAWGVSQTSWTGGSCSTPTRCCSFPRRAGGTGCSTS